MGLTHRALYNSKEGSLVFSKIVTEREMETNLFGLILSSGMNRWGEVRTGMELGSGRMCFLQSPPYPKKQASFYSLWALVGWFDSLWKFVTRDSEEGRFVEKKSLSDSFSQTSHPLLPFSQWEKWDHLVKDKRPSPNPKPAAHFSIFTFKPKVKLKMTISNRLFGIIRFLRNQTCLTGFNVS